MPKHCLQLPFIKICGLARLQDLALCARSGATAAGVLVVSDDHDKPNKDQLKLAEARGLIGAYPQELESVVLSKSTSQEYLSALCEELRPSFLQIQSDVSHKTIRHLRQSSPDAKIIKKIPVSPASSVSSLKDDLAQYIATGDVYAFLLDTAASPGGRGGTGQVHDWSLSADVVGAFPKSRFVMAGGLSPTNVDEAIKAIEPWGVDVMSGVSSSPGVKNAALVHRFVSAASAAFSEINPLRPTT